MTGRKKEIEELNRLYNSGKAEFVAIYGRRRVGKTYLVNETFRDRITFRHAGLSPLEYERSHALEEQLSHFYLSLKYQGLTGGKKPNSWLEAFYLLLRLLDQKNTGERQIVFIDEMPWLDTARSGFVTALEAFWNTWGCSRNNLMLIVCGSANSWVLDKLVNNHGGLYNRVTYEIKLAPFSLGECEEYLKSRGVYYSRYDIAQGYMIVGGIPYYLEYFTSTGRLSSDIDRMFFAKDAKLRDEFDRLFASVFAVPELAKAVVRLLGTRNSGFKRSEISEGLKKPDGAALAETLNALAASDFIIKYVPFGYKKNEVHYKLTDPFCLFYLHFMKKTDSLDVHFWQSNVSSQAVISWRGFAFENVCFNHISQIKKALGISGVASSESAWSKKADDREGTQIDMIISRRDNVINMCEIKFYTAEFSVNKEYYTKLLNRQTILSEELAKTSTVRNTLITTIGLKQNEYSGIFSQVVVLDDLFEAAP